MALARKKFDAETKKQVNIPFLFGKIEYSTGDPFNKKKSGASDRQVRSLYNSRRLIDAPSPAEKKKVEATKAQTKEIGDNTTNKSPDGEKKPWE